MLSPGVAGCAGRRHLRDVRSTGEVERAPRRKRSAYVSWVYPDRFTGKAVRNPRGNRSGPDTSQPSIPAAPGAVGLLSQVARIASHSAVDVPGEADRALPGLGRLRPPVAASPPVARPSDQGAEVADRPTPGAAGAPLRGGRGRRRRPRRRPRVFVLGSGPGRQRWPASAAGRGASPGKRLRAGTPPEGGDLHRS